MSQVALRGIARFSKFLFVLALLLMSTQVALAGADKVTLQEGADITFIKRLAVCQPMYIQVNENGIGKDTLTKVIYDASKVTNLYVISYDEIAQNIKSAKEVDIKALDWRKAAKEFKDNVGDFADAYVLLTVANNSRTECFFDVYQTGSNELLYTYRILADRADQDTAETFNSLCEQFYKNLDRSMANQRKEYQKK